MKSFRKPLMGLLIALAGLSLSLALIACAGGGAGRRAYQFQPGAFIGTAQGYNGILTVETVFSERRIESVTVIDHMETPNFALIPIQRIPFEIVQYQSLAVDRVAGATVTSVAIVAAVMDTVDQAVSGNPGALFAPRPARRQNPPATLQTQILVVGSGMAGLSAALEAAYHGADVLLIEKLGLIGGTTSTSGGIIHGSNNSIQRAAGYTADTPEIHLEFLLSLAGGIELNETFLEFAARSSGPSIDWLRSMGVIFNPTPNHSFYRFTSARALQTAGGAHLLMSSIGHEFTTPMARFARARGIEIMTETRAVSLIMDGNRVVGANAVDRTGGAITIRAENVILATGGFHYCPDMLQEFMPVIANAQGVNVIGAVAGNTGDGIIMARRDAGAATVKDSGQFTIGMMFMPETLASNLLVFPTGQRIDDESSYMMQWGSSVTAAGFNYAYVISDARTRNAAKDAAVAQGRAFQANTIAELAALINAGRFNTTGGHVMNPAVLTATVARYNEMARTGVDVDFGKPANYLFEINQPPFFAWVGDSFMVYGSRGGLEVDTWGRVLHTNGSIIPGLFAAGELANYRVLPINYGGSGQALTIYTAMGRLSGRAAATGVTNLNPVTDRWVVQP